MNWICANNLSHAETRHQRYPPQGDGFRRGKDHAQKKHRGAPLPILQGTQATLALQGDPFRFAAHGNQNP
ncbi:MAG: hypothetical protein GY862_19455, partial [Gammaproteobacteria bacterium]|nr:hypothetical protein [Gammaproteobacteria bacterium]